MVLEERVDSLARQVINDKVMLPNALNITEGEAGAKMCVLIPYIFCVKNGKSRSYSHFS